MENKKIDFTDIRKSQAIRILSCYKETDKIVKAFNEEEISKAEGSRGGKVIGHTKTGKPIYEPEHGFTSGAEHENESDKHHGLQSSPQKEGESHEDWVKRYNSPEESDRRSEHQVLRDYHAKKAKHIYKEKGVKGEHKKMKESKGGQGHKEMFDGGSGTMSSKIKTKNKTKKPIFGENEGDEDVTGKSEKIKKALETLGL